MHAREMLVGARKKVARGESENNFKFLIILPTSQGIHVPQLDGTRQTMNRLFYNKTKNNEKQALFRWLKVTLFLRKVDILNVSDWFMEIPVLHREMSLPDLPKSSW